MKKVWSFTRRWSTKCLNQAKKSVSMAQLETVSTSFCKGLSLWGNLKMWTWVSTQHGTSTTTWLISTSTSTAIVTSIPKKSAVSSPWLAPRCWKNLRLNKSGSSLTSCANSSYKASTYLRPIQVWIRRRLSQELLSCALFSTALKANWIWSTRQLKAVSVLTSPTQTRFMCAWQLWNKCISSNRVRVLDLTLSIQLLKWRATLLAKLWTRRQFA